MRFQKVTQSYLTRLYTRWTHQCSARAAQNI